METRGKFPFVRILSFVLTFMLTSLFLPAPVQTAQAGTILAAPSGVQATASGSDSIKLNWNPVAGASGYNIYRSTASGGTYSYIGSAWSAPEYLNKGLAADTTYYYKVRPYQKVDGVTTDGLYSLVVSAATQAKPVLAAPTNLKAAAAGSDSIRLTWSAVTGASGYNIYRSTASGGTYSYVGSAWSSPDFLSKGLTTGTTYYYKVRAYQKVDGITTDGLYSSVVSAVPLGANQLAAPGDLKAAALGSDAIKLTWSPVAGASGYNIYRSTVSGGTYSYVGSAWSLPEYTNKSLTAGTTYYYKVRAYKKTDGVTTDGFYSQVASAATAAKLVLSPPAEVVAAAAGSDSIALTWTAVTEAEGYQVYRAATPEGTYSRIKTVTGTTAYSDTGLAPETTYYYRITTSRLAEESGFSATVSAVTAGIELAAPGGLKVAGAGQTALKLAWNGVLGATGYQIYRADALDGSYTLVGSVADTPEFLNSGLTPATTYYYRIAASRPGEGAEEEGPSSQILTAVTASVLAAPSGLLAASTDSTTIRLTWDRVTGASGYNIYRSTTPTGGYSYVASAWSAPEYSNSGLTTGKTYYYKVRAYRKTGTITDDGLYTGSVWAVAGGPTTEPLLAPADLTAEVLGSDRIRLTWSPVTGANGYNIYRSLSLTGTYSYVASAWAAPEYLNQGLETGTTYYYKVRAYRFVGTVTQDGQYSAVVSAETGLRLPAPGAFTAQAAEADSIDLAWEAVSGAADYQIHRAVSAGGPYTPLAVTPELTYRDGGLTAGMNYYYKVQALPAEGTEPGQLSAFAWASPAADLAKLPAPANLQAAPTGTDSIRLTWSAVSGAAGYHLYTAASPEDPFELLESVSDALEYSHSGLGPATARTYRISAWRTVEGASEEGLLSETVSAVTAAVSPPLPAPANLIGFSSGSDRITLRWDPVAGASGYNIYKYSALTGTFNYQGSTWAVPEYTKSSLTTGKTYEYKVRAYKKVGTVTEDGIYSEVIAVTPVAQAVPDALVITEGQLPYSGKRIALTFDDQAEATHIESILNTLDQYGAKATFFALGEWVQDNPVLAVDITARGHSLQSHGLTHIDLNIQTDLEVRRQLAESSRIITELTGIAPTLLRPPYGSSSPSVIRIAQEEGYRYVVIWSADSHDWADTIGGVTVTTDYIVDRVLANATNNGIICLHMWPDRTLEALPRILEGLQAQGYSFVTVNDMVP